MVFRTTGLKGDDHDSRGKRWKSGKVHDGVDHLTKDPPTLMEIAHLEQSIGHAHGMLFRFGKLQRIEDFLRKVVIMQDATLHKRRRHAADESWILHGVFPDEKVVCLSRS